MKKLCACACFLLNVAILSAATTIDIDGITWEYSIGEDGGEKIVRLWSFSAPKDIECVVVPPVIEGCPVSYLADSLCDSMRIYDSLKTITIPANVRFIVFKKICALENIVVDPANSVYWSFDGVLYRRNDGYNSLVSFPAKKTGFLVIPI